ncbi:hypothetical protein WA556_003105 [Blastocystis sp. ATCC 50177/Nand II]
MIRSGTNAARVALRRFLNRSPLPCVTSFMRPFSQESDFNAALKDYVLKQDLKKDFTEYKHEADRKEMLRDFYYSLVEDPGKLDISKQRDHNHCLLCHMPSDLITYTNIGLLRLFIHESGTIYSHHVTGTCKKHQRQIVRCIKHARMAGLLPFLLTPKDYELYEMSGKKGEEEEEEPEEETLSMKLNKADTEEKEEVASEDFAKLMNLLSSDEKGSSEVQKE